MNECTMEHRSGTINNSIIKAKEKLKTCVCMMPQRVSCVLAELRQNSQLCDGIIICDDDVQIKVHRVILSSVSSYFKAHFTNSLNVGPSEIVQAKVDAPSHIFRKLLDFAYTGHCTIEEDNVEALLRVADQYHVIGLIQLCCKYILDWLQPTNCLGILRIARHYFCNDLEKEAKHYIRHNFVKFLNEGKDFDNLTMEEFVEILEDDELNVRNEEFVYDAVRRWVNVSSSERKVCLLPLLKCVRIANLSNKFVTDNVLAWSLVAENMDCRRYVMGIMDTTRNNVDVNNVLWRPRIPYEILFAIGGWSAEIPTNLIETYDIRADRWLLSVDTDDVPRAHHGLCVLNGCIYMIGGYLGHHEDLDTVKCFNPVNHKWSECACLNYRRSHVSVVMHDNKIYAMGGYEDLERMESVERYNANDNEWVLIKAMQKPRADASAAVLNDKIYIVGGEDDLSVMSSAEVYDTLTHQWTYIPSMLSARVGVSLVAFKNTIYALGGWTIPGDLYLATGEKFTPGVSPGWEPIKEMFRPRANFATVILDDLIFVLGGHDGHTNLNYVECYDTDTNEWMHASPMNVSRRGLSACILSGLPNARDYSFMGRSKEVKTA